MHEALLWLFVFVVWCFWITSSEVVEMKWYLIYRFRWVGKELHKERHPIDGVYATHRDQAAQIAATRNDYRRDEKLVPQFCYTAHERQLASDLDGRHSVGDWWSRTDFIDWMCQPAFAGDQDKYLRTWTI
jgi:hypothetical protein